MIYGSIQKTQGFILVQAGALRPVSEMIECVFLAWMLWSSYNGGARMVEEVEDLELGDELPERKLQEPFYGVRMSEWVWIPKMGALTALI